MGRVDGKVAFITGAGRGQGRSHAVRLAEEGAAVVAMDLCADAGNDYAPPATPEDLEQTVALVKKAGGRIVSQIADVRDPAQVDQVVAAGIAEFGHIDVAISNAAVSNFGLAWEIPYEDWQNTLDTNLTGAFNVVKAVVPRMIAEGRGGSLVFIGSTCGNRGLPLNIHYVAAKHGLVGFAQALAVEAGQHDIRANVIHPGGVNTPMGANNGEALFGQLDNHPELFRWMFTTPLAVENGLLEPIDISHAVVYLASDESRYATGMVMALDAGMSL